MKSGKLISRLAGLTLLIGLLQTTNAAAALQVFACEPEWGALTQELTGNLADVYTATTAQQDPHHIQARPSLIAKIRRADLVVCTGAELEVGWMPVLLRRGSNSQVQPGQPGYFEAANYVHMLGVPQRLDRAEGDIHPDGNPHIQTDPRNILLVAKALGQRLAELDPANQSVYQSRLQSFEQRWTAAIQKWESQAAPLRGVAIVVHHEGWAYLTRWLGLKVVSSLEPKPGIPPSSSDLQTLLQRVKEHPVAMDVHAAYQDSRPDDWFAEHAHVKAVALPFTVGGTPKAQDLFGLFDDTVNRLLAGMKP
jgi:zinc/manganese transport system substrate-binding protein